MFKLMIQKDGKLKKFAVTPGFAVVDIRERYESKWLAQKTADALNSSRQFIKAGIIVVVSVGKAS